MAGVGLRLSSCACWCCSKTFSPGTPTVPHLRTLTQWGAMGIAELSPCASAPRVKPHLPNLKESRVGDQPGPAEGEEGRSRVQSFHSCHLSPLPRGVPPRQLHDGKKAWGCQNPVTGHSPTASQGVARLQPARPALRAAMQACSFSRLGCVPSLLLGEVLETPSTPGTDHFCFL